MNRVDVIVVGGGAAGLMCALTAAGRGRRVVVLEGSNRIGKKILMSGGGRCNFTNLHCEPSRFISRNPGFCISALSRYTQWDFIALVEKHGIAFHEKTAGQLFCDESSKQIVAMLAAECSAADVRILTDCAIADVSRDNGYAVVTAHGVFAAPSLVIASGGLSIPKMGASDFGYRLARSLGLQVVTTRAGLVPFTFTGKLHELSQRLAGVSTPATVRTDAVEFTENILFTHRGLSGPAALQASSYWEAGQDIGIDFLPGMDATELLLQAKAGQPKAQLRSTLSRYLPKALTDELQSQLCPELTGRPLGEVPAASLRDLAGRLHDWHVRPAATEGYRTAEVTLGGIDTDELSSKTMESRRCPGLYCIGEVVDVSGHLGGFNFQWAWASGHAAGTAV